MNTLFQKVNSVFLNETKFCREYMCMNCPTLHHGEHLQLHEPPILFYHLWCNHVQDWEHPGKNKTEIVLKFQCTSTILSHTRQDYHKRAKEIVSFYNCTFLPKLAYVPWTCNNQTDLIYFAFSSLSPPGSAQVSSFVSVAFAYFKFYNLLFLGKILMFSQGHSHFKFGFLLFTVPLWAK